MNRHIKQLLNEESHTLFHLRQKHKSSYYPIFRDFCVDNHEKEPHDFLEKIIEDAIQIIFLLAETKTKSMMFHNIIECFCNAHERDKEIAYYSFVLNLGYQYNWWRYDQIPVNDNALKVRAVYGLTKEYLEDLNKSIKYYPMVIKPRRVRKHRNNRGAGLLKDKVDSLLLGNFHYKGDINREHLDRLNATEFVLNKDVISWFKPRISNQEEEDEHTLELFSNHIEVLNKELDYFYLIHKYDSRGRCYPVSYELNYQGTGYSKALLELNQKELIEDEKQIEIFVFGSNLKGIHGKGAALYALNNYGAIYGVGKGLQGRSYAIPTKYNPKQTLPINLIKEYVDEFISFARANKQYKFILTPIGTGLAGYKHEDIKPLFKDISNNILLPKEWL